MTPEQRKRWIATLREYAEDSGHPKPAELWSEQELLTNTNTNLVAQVWWDIKRNSLEYNTVTL